MASFPRITLLALGAAAALVLSGCLNPSPTPSPSSTSSSTPVFASEEEALAAATEAYAAYLAVSDQIAIGGWRDTSKLSTVVAADALSQDMQDAAEFSQRGLVQTGSTTFDSMQLQKLDENDAEGLVLRAYVCLDVSSVNILDREEESIVPNDRPINYPLELAFAFDAQSAAQLVLARSESWSGTNFC